MLSPLSKTEQLIMDHHNNAGGKHMATTKSWVLMKPKTMVQKEFPIPEVGPGDLLLKIKATCICGSDPHRYLNDDGKAVYPLILGHEYSGVVEKIGPDAERIYGVTVGDRITAEPYVACGHCEYCKTGFYNLCTGGGFTYGWNITCEEPPYINGAYGEYILIRPNSKVFKLKEGVSFIDGTISSVLGNAYRMVKDKAQLNSNESCLIYGAGALGLCALIVAKEQGVYPIIVANRDEHKLEIAKELGADYLIHLKSEDCVERIMEITEGRGVDAALECTGAEPSFQKVIDSVRKGGTVVLLGLTGGKNVPMPIDSIVSRELKVLGSIGQPNDVEYAMKIINKQKYPLNKIITHKYPMSKAPEAIEYFISKKDPTCIRCVLVNEEE